MGDFDFEKWRDRLHHCENFESEAKSNEFLALLLDVEKRLDYLVLVELLKTFSDADDFGVQERTRNLVESAERPTLYKALVHELEGLIKRSPQKQWAVTLIGIELEYGDFGELIRIAEEASDSNEQIFFEFIASDQFLSEYPEVTSYLKGR